MNFKEFENSVHKTRKNLQTKSEVRFDLEEKIFNQIDTFEVSDKKSAQKVSLWLKVVDVMTPKSLAVEHGLSFALIVLLVVGSGFASIKASERTLPGSPLYSVKVVSEKVDYLLSFTHQRRARTSMKIALKRADEFNQIINKIENQQENTDSAKKVSSEIQKELENIKTRINDVKENDPGNLIAVAREAGDNLKQMTAIVLDNEIKIAQTDILKHEQNKLAKQMEEVDFLVLATMVDSDVNVQEVRVKIQEKIESILKEVEGLAVEDLAEEEKENIRTEMEMATQMLANEDPKGAIRKIMDVRDVLKKISLEKNKIIEDQLASTEGGEPADDEPVEPVVEDSTPESSLEEIVEQEIGQDYPEITNIKKEVSEGEFQINMFE
jgi:hypothetical protein